MMNLIRNVRNLFGSLLYSLKQCVGLDR